MFADLISRFKNSLKGQRELTDSNIAEAVSQVQSVLLEADVNYSIVNKFIEGIKQKAVGTTFVKTSVTAGDYFIKIIYDELVTLMGSVESPLHLSGSPASILLCGLQGSGKTTTAMKLAYFLKTTHKKKVLVVACDLQRPAAVEQLEFLCRPLEIPVFSIPQASNPVKVAREAHAKAVAEQFQVLILDTAGRLHVDEKLMDELAQIKREIRPHETLFVANSTTGQDAVKTALEFDAKVQITGTILTLLDSNARGGAAISITEVTKKPLKFECVGEKPQDLQPFNPQSMADRILGRGDMINLIRKTKQVIDEVETQKLQQKLKKASITYDDYLKQIKMIQRMGPLKGLLQMLPGGSQLALGQHPEKELKIAEAIILSMTLEEREAVVELVPSRRWRLAKGSGNSVDDVNRFVKGFKRAKEFMKKAPKKWLEGLPKDLDGLLK